MKKLIILAALAACLALPAFSAGGAEQTAAGGAAPEIAVSLPGSVEFFMIQRKGMDKAAAELGVKLLYADAEWDPGRQLSQVENFIAKKVSLILLCASDNQALLPAVDMARKAGIPLVTFTNALGPRSDGVLDGVVTYVGLNDTTAGELMGVMAERLLGDKKADIVLIEGTPGTAPQRLRAEGFRKVAQKYPNWNIVYTQAIQGWTKEGALSAMEAFLQTKKNVDLVACQWNSAAVAVADALAEAKSEKKVYVTGLEFSREIAPYLADGRVDMTTNYSIERMGYTAVEAAVKTLKGEKLPRTIEVKAEIIDAKNVATQVPEL